MVRSADENQQKRWVELHSYFFPSVPSRDGSFGVLSAILRFSFDGLDGSTMIHWDDGFVLSFVIRVPWSLSNFSPNWLTHRFHRLMAYTETGLALSGTDTWQTSLDRHGRDLVRADFLQDIGMQFPWSQKTAHVNWFPNRSIDHGAWKSGCQKKDDV